MSIAAVLLTLLPSLALAQASEPEYSESASTAGEPAVTGAGATALTSEEASAPAAIPPGPVVEYESTVVGTRSRHAIVRDHRAVSVVTAEDIAERAPRTTPEALDMVPGVSVQKTNHAGGSPFIRGRTGQETLILLDGFRFNTSIMRSGPNQYLNTIDPHLLDGIEVLRGPGSVLYGSDAIGGVINVITRDPHGGDMEGLAHLRGASADRSAVGRAQVTGRVGPADVQIGLGARRFGELRGAGPLPMAEVPVYDGNVQRFTGYEELAGDVKVSFDVLDRGELTAALIAFHQFDAPRTDKCSPAPLDCRYFDEQFYDMGYLRYRDDLPGLDEVELGAMVARTHERRERIREERDQQTNEVDDVLTLGLTGRASLPKYALGRRGALRVSFGAESYLDMLASEASTEVLSTGAVMPEMRGKYLDGSRYLTAAGFTFTELVVTPSLSFTGGARLTAARASVAADPESDRDAFNQTSVVPVAGGGVRLAVAEGIALVGNIDQGFRAPNLDDLTARSDEGPGFQIANPDLQPETSLTLEGGLVVRRPWLVASGFAYQSFIDDFIGRIATECPPALAAQCGTAENVYTLTNAASASIHGVEMAAEARLPAGVRLFGNATWTVATRIVPAGADMPESKIPPLSGRGGIRMDLGQGRYLVEGMARWALRQDRLSPADQTDSRIPPSGTPGYAVFDIRASARLDHRLRASLAVENLTNTAYRVHGSGVDGAGLGVIASITGSTGAL